MPKILCTAFSAAEELIGARAFRVIFALVSLPLAVVAVVYFINHRYTGTPLWNVRGQPFVHELVWGLSFISFFFLYPSTFNLLEVSFFCYTFGALCIHPQVPQPLHKVEDPVIRSGYSMCSVHQVAAVDEPKLHLWDTGVIRITRHPQVLLIEPEHLALYS